MCNSHYCNVVRLARITANLWHGPVGNNPFFCRCSCWRSTLPWMPTPRPFATTSTHGRCGCPRRCLSFLTSPTGSLINMSTWNHPSPTYLVKTDKGSSIHWTHSKPASIGLLPCYIKYIPVLICMEHEPSLQKTKKSLVSCGSGLTRSCRPDPTLNPGAVERVSNAPLCSATAAQAGGTIIHQLILHTQIIITSAIQCLLKDIYKKRKKKNPT